jgi:phage protein D
MVRGITPDKSASSEHGNNAERANTSVGNTSAGSALAPEKSASSEHGNNAERADTSVGNTSAGTALAPEKSAEATAEKQRDVYSDGTIYVCGETYYYCINTFEDIPETAPEEAAKQEVKA